MLEIKDNKFCCGCQACFEACPTKCISMVADNEGFLYPKANNDGCIDCHLCEKVCPQISDSSSKREDEPLACYAAISKDEAIRLQSSSGGVFSQLAAAILERGGVVFGARFDDSFLVYHSYTETIAGLSPFRGSKYSQSDLRGAYSKVQQYLKEDRLVLFTGTPCQIAGLRGFLRQNISDNLFLVSIVCFGSPSPRVWKDYLYNVTSGDSPSYVNMRGKDNGWGQYRLIVRCGEKELFNEQATDTPYMRAMLLGLTLRPACYSCRFRGDHGSDITIGDYWGIENIHPEMFDGKGTSVIIVYSEKGQRLLNGLNITLLKSRYDTVVSGNPAIVSTATEPTRRTRFWKEYQASGVRILRKYTSPSFLTKVRNVFNDYLRKIK